MGTTVPRMGDDLTAYVAAVIRADLAVDRRTGKQLAEVAGVPYPTLARYLAGTREMPLSVLDQVAGHLRLSTASGVVAAAEQLRHDSAG